MRSHVSSSDVKVKAQQIIGDLLNKKETPDFTYRTDSRDEYEVLLEAARIGLFKESLNLGRKGLWLNKRIVHTPHRSQIQTRRSDD